MTGALPRWLSRMLAVALMVAVVGLLYGAVIGPLIAGYDEVERAIVRAEELLARYRRVAATRGALDRQLIDLDQRQTQRGIYLSGHTDALAAAALQDIVKGAVDSGGGDLRSIQILPAAEKEGLRSVGVRMQLMANIVELQRVLHTLEASSALLFVDNLDINNRQTRSRRSEGAAETDPALLVRMDVTGYLQPVVK